jgi:hypothetical protein
VEEIKYLKGNESELMSFLERTENTRPIYRKLFYEVIDVISSNIQYRFKELPKLKCMSVLDYTNFLEFQKHFPETLLSNLKVSYGHFVFILIV